jgi:putative ABC transport system substrate-binding protein
MRRREFIALVGGTAALWPLSVSAQQADKVHRIGFLGLGTASTWAPRVNALRTGLREHGYSRSIGCAMERPNWPAETSK